MAEVKDYFTGAVTLDRQEFGKLFANSIHLHDYTAYCRATRPQRIHCIRWGYLNGSSRPAAENGAALHQIFQLPDSESVTGDTAVMSSSLQLFEQRED